MLQKDNFYSVKAQSFITDKSCIPDFSEKEIENQKLKGKMLVEQIHRAAADTEQSSFTVPAGNYGFDLETDNTGICFHDIKRPDDNPFTVYADGAVFWIEPSGKPFHFSSFGFVVRNCANIHFVNLTISEYIPNNIEGIITAIDAENNRMSIRITNSSMPVKTNADAQKAVDGNQCRIIPYKANGEHIAPLFRTESSHWGPGDMWITEMKETGKENEFRITPKTDLLIKAITSKKWQDVYGDAGTLREGDYITILFGNICYKLENSRKIQMIGLKSYLSKSMIFENGGYGGHLWKDCYFGRMRETSRILGGGEYMLEGTRVGTTLDNVHMYGSTDDQINIHGFWASPESAEGKKITLKYLENGALKGDKAEIYDASGSLVKTLTLSEDVPFHNFHSLTDVYFEEDVPEKLDGCFIRFPALECDGWVIKNCEFINNYQRILIQSGSGVFENNRICNMGAYMEIHSNTCIYEGGVLGNMTFKNNVFCNSANMPQGRIFSFSQTPEWNNKLIGGDMEISDNIFIRCANLVRAENLNSLKFRNNTVVDPIIYPDNKCSEFSKLIKEIKEVGDTDISDNVLFSAANKETKTDENNNLSTVISRELPDKICLYARYSDASAEETENVILNHIKQGK